MSEITCFRSGSGRLHVTVILGLYDRKVAGWSVSSNMSASDTSIAAWRMAVNNRTPREGLIFHPDRGVQYACNEYSQILSTQKVIRSISLKGNCRDNAIAESFFKPLKVERDYQCRFTKHHAAGTQISQWTEGRYNRNRRHSALGNRLSKRSVKHTAYKMSLNFLSGNPLQVYSFIASLSRIALLKVDRG